MTQNNALNQAIVNSYNKFLRLTSNPQAAAILTQTAVNYQATGKTVEAIKNFRLGDEKLISILQSIINDLTSYKKERSSVTNTRQT